MSKDRLLIIEEALANFSKDRPTLNQNNTPERLLELLEGELQELKEAKNLEEAQLEIADLIIFSINLAHALGMDIHPVIMEKIAFNHARYISADFQDGSYEEARRRGKQREIEVKKDFADIF